MRKVPTSLVRCDPMSDHASCGLLQMEHSVPPELMYSTYWYRSGTNKTMRDHLRGIAKESMDFVGLDSCRVLDIGCNDGTLLGFYPDSCELVGIDPSDACEKLEGNITLFNELFPSRAFMEWNAGRKFDLVTSVAMFYDLEDPVEFARQVKQFLADDGIWVIELSYLPSMLRRNSYDTICHEHLEYYSIAVLEFIVRTAGLKLVRAEENTINGGSIRCFVSHAECTRYASAAAQARIQALRIAEFDLALDSDEPYTAFQERITRQKEKLVALLQRLKQEGRTIHVYGASTKGNTILQWCGIGKNFIDAASDRNPAKFGAHAVGSDIPIISEQESRALRPDYYLVLPWHFREEFLVREQQMLNQGTGFIFPLPEVEIVEGMAPVVSVMAAVSVSA